MGGISGFDRIEEERKDLSFFKILQSADLTSESIRAFPYNFIRRVSEKDFSYKMVIRAKWGSSWDIEVSKNQRFYYMEKRGWNQFVSDNALGENEFITFTLKGKMCFNVNIYEQNGQEMLVPRKIQTMGEIKKEEERSFKDVKKEEETGESLNGVEVGVREKRTEESKTYKKKIKSKKLGESMGGGVEVRGRKRKDKEAKTTKKKRKSKKNGVPQFTITIRKSYLKFLAIPKHFVKHIPNVSTIFTIYDLNGNYSWNVLCLVRENRTIFSSGWTKLAREYPLLINDICTFKLINPTELLLVIS